MAGTKELASLVARLEAVTSKLEGIAAGGGGDDSACKLCIEVCNEGTARIECMHYSRMRNISLSVEEYQLFNN